jgi:type I restriction enzyme, S subunit
MYKLVKLSKIANVTTGFPFKGKLYSDHGIRVVRGENVTVGSLRWDSIKCWNQDFDQIEKYFLKDSDVVIGMDGSKVGQNRARIKSEDLPLILAQRVALIRNNELSDQNFLYYIIRANRFEEFVEKIQTGSSVPHISQKQIEEYPVPFIPVDIQKRISNILLSLDSKIEINNRINIELELMAKTLYDYWFVQFDFPDRYGKPYKSSGGNMTWNEELKRAIPEDWDVKSLIDITSLLVRGVSPKYIEDKGVAVLNQKCIRNKAIDFTFGRRHDMESKNAKSKLIHIEDVLVNSTGVGTLGRVAMVKRLEERQTTVDSHVTIVRMDKEKANRFFMSYSLTQRQGEIEQLGEGSTGQTELSRDNLGRLKLLVPPDEIQKSFEDTIKPQIQKIGNNERENQKLSELRDWLLPMLMNGQVRPK